MIFRFLTALAVVVITILLMTIIGAALALFGFPVLTEIGSFLKTYAGIIGILAGLWYFFFGYRNFLRG